MAVTGKDICTWANLSIGGDLIPAAEADDPSSFTGEEPHVQLYKALYALHRDALLARHAWRFASRNFYKAYEDQLYTVTAATQANPVVVTAPGNPFPDYKYVYFEDVGGMTELNGETIRIYDVDAAAGTFKLEGIDGSAFEAFTSGGTVRLRPPFKYEYEFILPSDFIRDIRLIDSESEYEIMDGGLLTNDSEISLQYIGRVEDSDRFDPMFAQALAHFLAITAARRSADSRKWSDFAMKEFSTVIREAGQMNAFMGKPSTKMPDNDWQSAGRF